MSNIVERFLHSLKAFRCITIEEYWKNVMEMLFDIYTSTDLTRQGPVTSSLKKKGTLCLDRVGDGIYFQVIKKKRKKKSVPDSK